MEAEEKDTGVGVSIAEESERKGRVYRNVQDEITFFIVGCIVQSCRTFALLVTIAAFSDQPISSMCSFAFASYLAGGFVVNLLATKKICRSSLSVLKILVPQVDAILGIFACFLWNTTFITLILMLYLPLMILCLILTFYELYSSIDQAYNLKFVRFAFILPVRRMHA